MAELSDGWGYDLERGPDWLFIRLHQPKEKSAIAEPQLAKKISQILEEHFTYRCVLEMDDVELLRSYLVGQLLMLREEVDSHDGVLRLSGLSDHCKQVLNDSRLTNRLRSYATRESAVIGDNQTCVM